VEGACTEAEPFALRVIGDSMEPEFRDGAIIIIDPTGVAKDGAFVIALHKGEYIFRQLVIENDRKMLKALNGDHPVIPLIDFSTIEGVVTQRAGTRRRDHKHYD